MNFLITPTMCQVDDDIAQSMLILLVVYRTYRLHLDVMYDLIVQTNCTYVRVSNYPELYRCTQCIFIMSTNTIK